MVLRACAKSQLLHHYCLLLLKKSIVVVVAHIYSLVTGQRQTLNIGRSRVLFVAMTSLWLEESAPA